MTPEKQDKTLELIKHWSAHSTPARKMRNAACDHVTATFEPGSLATKVQNVIKALDDIRIEMGFMKNT